MARKRGKGESLSGYFRKLFEENPEWLKGTSNDVVVERYKADHPGHEVTQRIRQSMANIKSTLRGKFGLKVAPKGGKRKKVGTVVKSASGNALDRLELSIDNCLHVARGLERPELDEAIKHLRRARNAVVWVLGEPARV